MSKLLLVSCCAPCSCAVIAKLAEEKRNFAVLFYNPNIQPAEEYEKRRQENERFCQERNVPFISLEYDPENWLQAVKGFENEPERGERCSVCFHLRLKRAMEYAKENGFDAVSSVLGVSRYKDMAQVNRAAQKASEETGVFYDETNWRKGGLEQQRQQLVKETGMYAQDYFGCPFSVRTPSSICGKSRLSKSI
ncbi:MAG: epoxyqueuosine reductase QueH [Alphaproteobacteria bacterium]|nr:epoxyqueuosine reductase QueH [Alphaproteobacteria bacterium]